jgi:uncharacterized protein
MTPFYFGSGERRLFGIYEPDLSGSEKARAAVLCYPWGPEYLHAHRAMRQLGTKLTRAGFHTLRFDYFGTGDSAGEMTETTLFGFEADIESAIDELKSMTGATRVALIGLRLGATLAAAVGAKRAGEVNDLVLWDPVVSGTEYLTELTSHSHPTGRMPGQPSDVTCYEIRGFSMTPNVAREVLMVDLPHLLPASSSRVLIITTLPLGSHHRLHSIQAKPGNESLAIEHMSDISPWIEDTTKAGALPVSVIQRIVQWLR